MGPLDFIQFIFTAAACLILAAACIAGTYSGCLFFYHLGLKAHKQLSAKIDAMKRWRPGRSSRRRKSKPAPASGSGKSLKLAGGAK